MDPVPDDWCMEDDKWVISDDKIRLYLENMYDHEYEHVSKNRTRYPQSVQAVIAEYDYRRAAPVETKLKIRIEDLTDYDLYVMKLKEKREKMAKVEKLWEEHKKTNSVERPPSYIDGLCDRVYTKLQTKREEFVVACEKTPIKLHKSYIPPSKRLAIAAEDPTLIPLRKEIENLENEFEDLKKKIEEEDAAWEQTAKYEFATKTAMWNV